MNDQVMFRKVVHDLEELPAIEDQSASQRKFFSEVSSALLRGHLEVLIQERDWITGIIMSVSILEFAGKTRLIWKQKDALKTGTRKIYRLKFAATIELLFNNKIIDDTTRDEMIKIKDARNAAAHDLPHQVALSRGKEANDVIEGHIKNAVKIMESLFSKTD